MKPTLNLKNFIAIALILFGLTLVVQQFQNVPTNDIVVLDIKEPSKEILELVAPIAKSITDPTDRAKLAVFNQEFASRIRKYNSDNQQTNDVYVLAASYFFKDSLKDKYDNLDTNIIELLKSSIGEDNHILTDLEKEDIANKFLGLAWSLIQK